MSIKNQLWLRWLIYSIPIIILVGAGGLVAWATLRAQEATERAVKVLNQNDIRLEDGLILRSDPNSAEIIAATVQFLDTLN